MREQKQSGAATEEKPKSGKEWKAECAAYRKAIEAVIELYSECPICWKLWEEGGHTEECEIGQALASVVASAERISPSAKAPIAMGLLLTETGELLRALRLRLSQRITWFKNPRVHDNDWWVTDFTHGQVEGNLKDCVRMIDRALGEPLISSDATQPQVTP